MKQSHIILISVMSLVLMKPAYGAMGVANITGTVEDSELTGSLKFEDTSGGLKITGHLENVPMGEHAFHIHEFGDCSEEGNAAGSHYNPDHKPHGQVMKDGTHKVHPGDLGNLIVKEDGTASVSLTIPGVALSEGRYTVAGRAVIVHEKKDDFGQPTGNAGSRIGCGTIVLTGK